MAIKAYLFEPPVLEHASLIPRSVMNTLSPSPKTAVYNHNSTQDYTYSLSIDHCFDNKNCKQGDRTGIIRCFCQLDLPLRTGVLRVFSPTPIPVCFSQIDL